MEKQTSTKHLRTRFNIQSFRKGGSGELMKQRAASWAEECIEILENHRIPYFAGNNVIPPTGVVIFEYPPAHVLAELHFVFGDDFFEIVGSDGSTNSYDSSPETKREAV